MSSAKNYYTIMYYIYCNYAPVVYYLYNINIYYFDCSDAVVQQLEYPLEYPLAL